jgi:glycosyltransferase involved in cell wall biosynthesis
MKIAIVVSHPIQHFCPMYASWAKNQNVELIVFFASNLGVQTYNDPDFGREVKWGNLYLNEFNHLFLNDQTALAVNQSLDAPSLEDELLKFRPDLVIQYGRIYKFNKRVRIWTKKNNVKLAYISDSENRHAESIFKLVVKRVVFPFYFWGIDYFFTVGDSNEDFYRQYYVKNYKMFRMNFSIDINHFDSCYEKRHVLRNQLRKNLDIADNEIVISVVGKLVEWKSHKDLISLLYLIEKNGGWPKIHLIIAGSGPLEITLKLQADNLKINCVHFLGFVDTTDLPIVYAASDIYGHPSKFDRHSLSVSEAIYMGLPVIISDTTGSHGPTDDVRDGLNGYVFEQGNIFDLYEKFCRLRNSERRMRLGNNSKKIANNIQYNAHYGFLNNFIDFVKNS